MQTPSVQLLYDEIGVKEMNLKEYEALLRKQEQKIVELNEANAQKDKFIQKQSYRLEEYKKSMKEVGELRKMVRELMTTE